MCSSDLTYRSSIGDRTDNAIYDYKDYTKKLYTYCLPFIIVCAGVIALMTNVDRLTGVLQGVATKSTQYEQAIGTYTGKFGDNSGEFIIEGQNGNKVEATIKVRFTNLVEEKLVGEIDMSKGTFHFDDVMSSNGKLDGQYNGTFSSDFTTMQGTYENYTSKKQVQFQFTK